MDSSTAIVFMISGVIPFLALVAVSFKTGFVSFSLLSLTRKDQPKYMIDQTKFRRFFGMAAGVFLLSVVVDLLIVQDASELPGILVLGLINTVFIAYVLVYFVLLKEKT